MLCYRWVSAAFLATICLFTINAAAADEAPCDRLFVPEGYELTCTVERKANEDAWELSVHPTDGAFASLSELTLSPVDGSIGDAEAWLTQQVKIDVSGLESALTSFLDDEDNPFAGESWWTSLQGLKDVVHSISDLPLDSCDAPRQVDEADWSIDCEWGLGSLRQYLTVHLVERDGVAYAIRIQSMNPRRHRHLQAIANSF
jgi:hypothetical protein